MTLSRIGMSGIRMTVVVLALTAGGCWLPMAIQFAPLALQAGIGAAASAVGASQKNEVVETPGVIEFRQDPAGAPEYRELRIAFTSSEARWAPLVERETSADGWRPAEHFLEMNFSPPLPTVLSADRITYLAYAPADPHSIDDDEQLAQFNKSFGDPVGTFTWNGHPYQYSLPQVLPALAFD